MDDVLDISFELGVNLPWWASAAAFVFIWFGVNLGLAVILGHAGVASAELQATVGKVTGLIFAGVWVLALLKKLEPRRRYRAGE